MFDKFWIFPNPGDSGSALGCILCKTKKRMRYTHTFWGYNIQRKLNVNDVVKELLNKKVVGVANGAAEFGQKALGNRSLLADPRKDVKNYVNSIKEDKSLDRFCSCNTRRIF